MKIEILISQDENGLYRACCLALPGCVAFGRTRSEARMNLQETTRGYLYSMDVAVPDNFECQAVAG